MTTLAYLALAAVLFLGSWLLNRRSRD